MIVYICNKCKKPIDMEKTDCVHLKIRYGKRAIESGGEE